MSIKRIKRLKPLDISRLNAGLHILKTVHKTKSVVNKPVSSGHAVNLPQSVVDEVNRTIMQEPCHEVYGSLAMKSKTFLAREPADIDMVVRNPKNTAHKINSQLRQKGHKSKVVCNPEFNSCVVQVEKNGEYVDAVDVHPSDTHYVKYDLFGSSIPPTRVNGFNVQTAADQLLRKANSVMSYNEKDNRMGPPEHRQDKDVSDFITTSRVLLDSKRLRAEAEIAQVNAARKNLKPWKKHVKTLKGHDPKTSRVGKDPIPEHKEQEFIRYAVDNPLVDVDDMFFSGSGVKVRKPTEENMFCEFNKPIAKKSAGKAKASTHEMMDFGVDPSWQIGVAPKRRKKR